MKKIFQQVLFVVCIASSAFPQSIQSFISIIGNQFYNGTNGLLPSGTIIFQAINSAGVPIAYQVGGGGQQITSPIVCMISNGSIAVSPACRLANVAQTNPVNICFKVTVKDSANNIVLGGSIQSGYGCAQPQPYNPNVQQSFWCTTISGSTTCDFDQFVPNVAGIPITRISWPTILNLGGVYVFTCPNGQVANGIAATGYLTCVTGGGSTGNAVWGQITGTLSNQADLSAALASLAPLSGPSFSNTSIFNGPVNFTGPEPFIYYTESGYCSFQGLAGQDAFCDQGSGAGGIPVWNIGGGSPALQFPLMRFQLGTINPGNLLVFTGNYIGPNPLLDIPPNVSLDSTLSILNRYAGQSTVGNGVSATFFQDDAVSLIVTRTHTLLSGSSSSGGHWRVCYAEEITVSDSSGRTVTMSLNFTSHGISRTWTSTTALTFISTANSDRQCVPLNVDNSSAVSYSANVSGTLTGGQYAVDIWMAKE